MQPAAGCLLHVSIFSPTPHGSTFSVRVTPRAGRTVIAGLRENVLLVKLAAAPVDGAANDALIALLSDAFDVPRRAVRVAAGERSRTKRIEVDGTAPRALEQRLAQIFDPHAT